MCAHRAARCATRSVRECCGVSRYRRCCGLQLCPAQARFVPRGVCFAETCLMRAGAKRDGSGGRGALTGARYLV